MIRPIGKNDFLNYYKKPYAFWFLTREEVEELLPNADPLEGMMDLSSEDLFHFLRQVDSQKSLYFSNFVCIKNLLNLRLKEFYLGRFNVPKLSFHDHSYYNTDATPQFLKAMASPGDVFIFSPRIQHGDLSMSPTAIYRYRGKVYLIEHLWSTALKRELLATFAYHRHVLEEHLGIGVDQCLITYLSPRRPEKRELLIEITNGLPFNSQKTYSGPLDDRLRNVNTFLGMDQIGYRGSLYELLWTEEEFNSVDCDPWEFEYPDIREILGILRSFRDNPDRSMDVVRLARDFLSRKGGLVPPDGPWFKLLLRAHEGDLDFSNKLIPLDRVMGKFLDYPRDKLSYFLDYSRGMKFLDFPEGRDYLLFRGAEERYRSLQERRVKIYYDFETISLPFPYLDGVKPYTQIVLQLSLLRLDDGRESGVRNLIVDPLTLGVDDFRRIIDLIYLDEPLVSYIVYNKSFENTRLREMAELIGGDEYAEKVQSIIDRTVDLAEWFSFDNSPMIIHRGLRGFHSIKRVIGLIPDNILKLTGTVQYSTLERCQNGSMAQALLISRALGLDGENSWDKNRSFMYKYCENDVRSMWATELFIGSLLVDHGQGHYSTRLYLSQKRNFRRT